MKFNTTGQKQNIVLLFMLPKKYIQKLIFEHNYKKINKLLPLFFNCFAKMTSKSQIQLKALKKKTAAINNKLRICLMEFELHEPNCKTQTKT